MRTTRTSLLGLSAVISLAAMATGPSTITYTNAASTAPRRPTPKRYVNKDAEIQKWNEAVDQRKKARKGR